MVDLGEGEKRKRITEGRKAGEASKTKLRPSSPSPLPFPLAQNLDPLLVYYCCCCLPEEDYALLVSSFCL